MGLVWYLKSYIQGNPRFGKSSQSGITTYIFGQAALIREKDIYIVITVVAVIAVLILIIFYKELKLLYLIANLPRHQDLIQGLCLYINLVMTILLITAGIKFVGVILISSMIIIQQ